MGQGREIDGGAGGGFSKALQVIRRALDRVFKALTLFFLIDFGLVIYGAWKYGGTITVGDFTNILFIEGILIVLCFYWVLTKD